MKDYNYIKNEIFIQKSMMIGIILFITLIFCIIKKIFIDLEPVFEQIMYTYFMVSSLIAMIFIDIISEFYSKKLIKRLHKFYTLIIFLSFIGIIFIRGNQLSNLYFKELNFKIIMGILSFEILISIILNEYSFKRESIKNIFIKFFLCMFISIFLMELKDTGFCFKLLLTIWQLFLVFKLFKYINNNTSNKLNNINLLKSSMILYVVIIGINIINQYFFEVGLFDEIVQLIHIIAFNMLSNIVISNLLKEPYKKIIKSMLSNNSELEQLSYQVILKNRQLEESITNMNNKEEIYSTFFRYMPHPVVIVNEENDRILFVNKKFLELIGVSATKNIVNKKIDNFIDYLDDRENKIYDGILKFNDVVKFISIKYFEYDQKKKIMLIKDNTSKVEIEKLKKEIENKRNQENIRTQFLSSISHDLKTPINVIYSVTQLQKIYIEQRDIDSLKRYNSICKTNCVNLIKLTNNLIDNSKIISDYLSPRLKKSNIVEIVEDNVMSLLEYVKCNNLELIFDTNTEECYINIDEEFIQRIILNLISNAIKYNKENGKIEVLIYETEDEVRISVKDNGIGMKEQFKEKAFDRYTAEKNNEQSMKKSSGLGLFVVKQLVELQNGKIEIRSKYNIGTNIIIIFKKDN